MPKPSLVPSVPATDRIPITGGWVRMRIPMTIDDLLALGEADTKIGPAIRAVKEACIESEFDNGKPLGEQPWSVMTEILKAWNASEDEVALPPANGQP